MKEPQYQALHKKVVRHLKRSHIPAVAADNNLPDSWLRRVMKKEIVRPASDRLIELADYFDIE